MDEGKNRQKQEMAHKYPNENIKEKVEDELNDSPVYSRTSITGNRCYMSGCKNNRICKDKCKSMPMFLFPTDRHLAKFWLGICNHQPYECPYHGQAVCKDHFRMENVAEGSLSDDSGIVLRPNVIPTKNIPNICYSMILAYLKQKRTGVALEPKEIGVDFSCNKQDCAARPKPSVRIRVYRKQPSTSTSSTDLDQCPKFKPQGVRITYK